ncbi:TlyA family RNA methyltransferase [Dethiothermospora halolimnae]|uniref:TlyA family RNA methyltransferase n=1 Tax=Dethiothermospora halolimnae TaxID=3114390 RepID=UPI003CCB864C
MKKVRLDKLLVDKNIIESREKAKKYIKTGNILVNGKKIRKPSTKINEESSIEIINDPIPYVGRGGLKLEKALRTFDISCKDKVAMDIGASTGGFTDCMLKNGATKVYAIDVGHGQLANKLKDDKRVINMEGRNIRYVKLEDLEELADFVTIDVSFISLKLVLPKVIEITKANVDVVALVKPQFEAGKEKVGKKGVVKDLKVHKEVLNDINSFCIDNNLTIIDLTYSPIKGGEGNIEYLAHIKRGIHSNFNIDNKIDGIAVKSHKNL